MNGMKSVQAKHPEFFRTDPCHLTCGGFDSLRKHLVGQIPSEDHFNRVQQVVLVAHG